jgi:hypothetical protein
LTAGQGGHDGSAGNDHLHALADAHFEGGDLAGGKKNQEAAGGIWRRGDEYGPDLLGGFSLGFPLGFVGQKADGPNAGPGEFDEHDLVEEIFVLRAERVDDLFDRIVNRADAGDAEHEALANADEKFSEDIARDIAEGGHDEHDADGTDDIPEKRQVAQRGGQAVKKERTHSAADERDDLGKGPDGDNQRGEQEGAGNEGVAKGDQAGLGVGQR